MRTRPPLPLLLAASLVAALALLPVGYLLLRMAAAGPEAWALLARPAVWSVFGNSALLAAVCTAGAVALGVPLAWLTARTDLPGRRFWSVALVLPLAMPSYIGAYAWIALLGPRGMLGRLLAPLGIGRLPEPYGLAGTALVITLINYPFVLLAVRAAIRRLDPALEEAALGLGLSRRQIFWRVTLPQLRGPIAAGGLLAAFYALSDFGAPALLRYKSFTRVIFIEYQSAFNRNTAALMALVLVGLTLAVLAAEAAVRGRSPLFRTGSGSRRPAAPIPLGRWKAPALVACAGVVTAALGLPILVILYWNVVGWRNGQGLWLSPSAVGNSLLAGTLAAAAAVVAAAPVAYLAGRYRRRLAGWADRSAYLGGALPGIVVALALVFFSARHLPAGLYQSLPLLVLAYVIRFLPQAIGCLRTSLAQIPPRLEEAARGLGRGRLRTFAAVTLPLLKPGALAGAALVFLTTVKELPVTLLLSPTGFDTLVYAIWSTASEGLFSQASPSALLLLGLSALSIAVILRQEERGLYG